MSRTVQHDGQSAFRVRFSYDPRLVELVKSLPNRRWNPGEKYWSVPEHDVVALVDLLHGEGFGFDETTRGLYEDRGGTVPLDGGPSGEGVAPRGLFESAASDDFTVGRLNREVRETLERAFPGSVWLVGEISGFNKSAHKRIVGFRLLERDEHGKPVAEVNATLFDDVRRRIQSELAASGDPFRLEDEIEIRCLARVELYEPWGQFRVRIEEIDVRYTLGEAARRREEIVRRLTEEGLVGRNTSLPFPELPLRVGLVTSLGSDAFNDVVRTLQESGFAFRVTAHGARVQGRQTEPSVLNALDWFRRRSADFDVVLICRGGGSRADLTWFDTDALGRAVALFPLPVVVGIGHEQDHSVLDFVGWRCKTPTAAAGSLAERVSASLTRVEESVRAILERAARYAREESLSGQDRARRLARASRGRLDLETAELRRRRHRTVLAARGLLDAASRELAHRALGVPRGSVRLLEGRRVALDQSARQLVQGARRDLGSSLRRVDELAAMLGPRSGRHLRLERERAGLRERRLHLVDPCRVLDRGYAVLRLPGGPVVTDPSEAPAGTPLEASVRRGVLRLRSEGGTTDGGE